MATDPLAAVTEAIGLWNGVARPNAAATRGLEDFPMLIREFETLRGTMVFEDEPAIFEAVLREEQEKGA